MMNTSLPLYAIKSGLKTPPPESVPRVVRTVFLLQYLSDPQLRQQITDRTNKVEAYNGFAKWLFFGGEGIIAEFNWVYSLLALIPFAFFFRMQKRERAWMIGLTAIYFFLSVLLVILLNPALDRQTRELTRVFFTASHVMIVIWIGYGLTMIGASLLVNYQKFRPLGLIGGALGVVLALYSLADTAKDMSAGLTNAGVFGTFFGAISRAFNPNQYGLPMIAGLLLLGLVVIFLVMLWLGRTKPHLGVALAVFAIMPMHSVIDHWADNEQRNHMFGYWFGHDMFTPPFRDKDGKLSYDPKARAEMMKDPVRGKYVYPEMTRDAILYGGTDPGRFCPTYMIFCESFIPPECKPADPNFDRRDVYIITQNALADGTYLMYIRSHYNKSTQIKYDKPFFRELFQTMLVRKQEERDYVIKPISKWAYEYLDKPFINLGNKIEARRRAEGVYPKKEMYIATPEDSQRCFQEYMADAQKRMQTGQLLPGEDVRVVKDPNGVDRVQVSGQVAVMAINGLLTKVMFDQNPTNEFFVEESFPLQWMYPHLTPFGVIMKINRQPLPTLSDDILKQDHDFWADYSERLIGNWITYDTPVKEIVDFVEKTYLRKDFTGFKGDRKFVRDDQGQKAFSKLRSSIAGVYSWRLGMNGAPIMDNQRPYLARPGSKEYTSLLREADFAFKQAFAFCPYSPEAVYRYMYVLMGSGRYEDAIMILETAIKLDPYNEQLERTLKQLKTIKVSSKAYDENLNKWRAEWKADPGNFQAAINMISLYDSMGRFDLCSDIVEEILRSPKLNPDAEIAVAQYCQAKSPGKFADMRPRLDAIINASNASVHHINAIVDLYVKGQDFGGIETGLARFAAMRPDSPEAQYELAAIKSVVGKQAEALTALKTSIALSDARLMSSPTSMNVRATLNGDPRFKALSVNPEFKSLVVKTPAQKL